MDNKKEIKDNDRRENIQQRPDHIDDKNKKPATPEPPQRKDPGAKPDAESKSKSK